ncbi:hypothetical protein QQF64_036422, partial [Cirrhinus molitorella]
SVEIRLVRSIRFIMDETQSSGDKGVFPGCRSVHQKRAEAELSCVSMKSDVSMDPPIGFNSGDSRTGLRSVHRKRPYPELSCVSVKSDASMDRPIKFNSGDSRTGLRRVHQKRSKPESSCVSMSHTSTRDTHPGV